MTPHRKAAAKPSQLTPLQHRLIVSGNPSCTPLTPRPRKEIHLFPIQRRGRPVALPRTRKKRGAPWSSIAAITLAVAGVIAATATIHEEAAAKRSLERCEQLANR